MNQKILNCVEKIFAEYDKDNNNYIEYEEAEKFFIDFFQMLGKDIDSEMIKALFKKFDVNNDNKLSKREVYKMIESI